MRGGVSAGGAGGASSLLRNNQRNTRRAPRHILGSNQTIRRMKRIIRARKIQGCWIAAHIPAKTAMSSPIESVQLENGSGEVFTTARVPALVAWVAAAMEPPTIKAASSAPMPNSPTAPAAIMAPAGMRIKVWMVSHKVSTPGILSAKNSTAYINPAAPMTSGFARMARSGGSTMLPVMLRTPSVKIAA